MQYIDIFNGDADGIFSLIQWRKAYPVPAEQQRLVAGVKRDNALVKQVTDEQAAGAMLTVLDISFDKNTDELARVLEQAEQVFYCDHHRAKTLFVHPKLESNIDFAATVCTGLLVSERLNHEYHLWAIAAAFGDGLDSVAEHEASQLGLSAEQTAQLRELGVLVNYNGYGANVEDLHFAPAALYRLLAAYDTPFDVVTDQSSPFVSLKQGYEADLAQALKSEVLEDTARVKAVVLDNVPWARRISGTYGNKLAAENPDTAIVVASYNADSTLTISLRAPKNNLQGAGDICSGFPTGGGRAGAAGINSMPVSQLSHFIHKVASFYSPREQ
ncbi:MAG: DHH family phosphoesterase [Firmicutes bacterium]|nr:DHH family phosphoesterase [Bacillota bacterium]